MASPAALIPILIAVGGVLLYLYVIKPLNLFGYLTVYMAPRWKQCYLYPWRIKEFFRAFKHVYVVDVRTESEFNQMNLRDFNNITVVLPFVPVDGTEFAERICEDSRLKDPLAMLQEVLVVCDTGERSMLACEKLMELGFNPVHLVCGLNRVPPSFMRYNDGTRSFHSL